VTERPLIMSAPMVRALLADTKTQTRRLVTPSRSIIGSLPQRDWPLLDFDAPGVFVDGKGEPTMFQPIANCQYLHVPHRAAAGELMHDTRHRVYSRVEPGDVLWVKETFYCDDYRYPDVPADERTPEWHSQMMYYRADVPSGRFQDAGYWAEPGSAWKPSIFMPRWASRLSLPVTSVRVERLCDISEADAVAEGVHVIALQEDGQSGAWWTGDASKGPRLHRRSAVAAYRALWCELNGAPSWDANPWVWIYDFKKDGAT